MTIVNRLGEEFDFELQGNEYQVPQIENETDYFDWAMGSEYITCDANSKSKHAGCYVVPRKNSFKTIDIQAGYIILNKGMIFKDILSRDLQKLNDKIPLYELYGDKLSGDKLRCPPIRRDLFIDKDNHDN